MTPPEQQSAALAYEEGRGMGQANTLFWIGKGLAYDGVIDIAQATASLRAGMSPSTPLPEDEDLVFGGLTGDEIKAIDLRRAHAAAAELRSYATYVGGDHKITEEHALATFREGFRAGAATPE